MKKLAVSGSKGNKRSRRAKARPGRPSIGIRELKARASSVIEEVKGRRITYAVTKRGAVEALIVPVDVGERLLGSPNANTAWEAWQALVEQLAQEPTKKAGSAVRELEQMRR